MYQNLHMFDWIAVNNDSLRTKIENTVYES